MNDVWRKAFIETMERSSPEQETEFLRLVDEVEGRCSLDVARTLMRSFSDRPDYGTQERVVSVLSSADPADAVCAVLEELPRLLKEAPEWAEVLVGQEVDNRPALLEQAANMASTDIRRAFRVLLKRDSFRDMYPDAYGLSVNIP